MHACPFTYLYSSPRGLHKCWLRAIDPHNAYLQGICHTLAPLQPQHITQVYRRAYAAPARHFQSCQQRRALRICMYTMLMPNPTLGMPAAAAAAAAHMRCSTPCCICWH